MKTLVLSNGKLKEKEIDNTLEELQKIVGGYIEIPRLCKRFSDNGVDAIINEEGKYIDGMRPEIAIVDSKTGAALDIVYGNCIFASHNDEGETISLNEEQVEIVMEELRMEIVLVNTEGKSTVAKALFV